MNLQLYYRVDQRFLYTDVGVALPRTLEVRTARTLTVKTIKYLQHKEQVSLHMKDLMLTFQQIQIPKTAHIKDPVDLITLLLLYSCFAIA